jgi:hypothetical protein
MKNPSGSKGDLAIDAEPLSGRCAVKPESSRIPLSREGGEITANNTTGTEAWEVDRACRFPREQSRKLKEGK